MELSFGADETALRDAVRRYVDERYGFESRRERLRQPEGCSLATWRELAELGVVGAALPAEHGGLGLGALGHLLVLEAFGRALPVEPYVATAVLGASALELGGDPAQRARLAEVAAGTRLLAFAHDEPGMRYEYAQPQARATFEGAAGYRLEGRKCGVAHAHVADELIVTARVAAGDVAAFVVPRATGGLELARFVAADGVPGADLELRGVRVPASARLGGEGAAGGGLDLVERVLDRARAAACAEAAGAMDALLARTIGYLGTRQQFGQPLARFQALQHRVADMAIECEQARSAALVAAAAADDADPAARRRGVSAAAAKTAEAATFVAEQAVQLHGGIGMTDDLDVSHYFRRLTALARAWGDAPWHLDRYLEASGR